MFFKNILLRFFRYLSSFKNYQPTQVQLFSKAWLDTRVKTIETKVLSHLKYSVTTAISSELYAIDSVKIAQGYVTVDIYLPLSLDLSKMVHVTPDLFQVEFDNSFKDFLSKGYSYTDFTVFPDKLKVKILLPKS
jgi:hypothetical protein